jgi:hypothetical protein
VGHLRSFKKWVWDHIKDEDLRDYDGEYFKMSGDAAILYPLIELCGKDRIKLIEKAVYVYNTENDLREYYIDLEAQCAAATRVKSKPQYSQISPDDGRFLDMPVNRNIFIVESRRSGVQIGKHVLGSLGFDVVDYSNEINNENTVIKINCSESIKIDSKIVKKAVVFVKSPLDVACCKTGRSIVINRTMPDNAFNIMVLRYFINLSRLILGWGQNVDLLIVFYEDLFKDSKQEIVKICEFLDVHFSDRYTHSLHDYFSYHKIDNTHEMLDSINDILRNYDFDLFKKEAHDYIMNNNMRL